MSRTLTRVVAAVPAAIPFVFGALRAFQTGTDFRYLATALGSLVPVAIVFYLGSPVTTTSSAWRRSLLALVAGTVMAGGTAFGVGARSLVAVFVVSLGFTLCIATSGTLGLFERRR